jgi:iron complex outermembrane receptor protein
MKRIVLVIMLLAASPVLARAASPTLLSADAIAALIKPPPHGERIVALWSLDCVYCEPELTALAKLQRSHPHDIELVLVATDGPAQRHAVATRLNKMGLTAFHAYLYDEASPERLNYLIDPHWGGELPHTVVIRADGSRSSFSGDVTPAQLRRITPH